MINVYDLRYSENPFECPGLLIGIGSAIGLLALIAIAAIICYAYGKNRILQQSKNGPNSMKSQQHDQGLNDHYPNRRKRPFSFAIFPRFARWTNRNHVRKIEVSCEMQSNEYTPNHF